MGNFYTDVILRSKEFHSLESVRSLELLEPTTRSAVKSIIAEAAEAGIDLIVTETYRSKERQELLFSHGATKLRTVGVHHYGLAADFAKIINGKPDWSGDWAFLRELAERHGLISGLDWGQPSVRHTFVDPDHVQRVTLSEQIALFAGTWYPDSTPEVIS